MGRKSALVLTCFQFCLFEEEVMWQTKWLKALNSFEWISNQLQVARNRDCTASGGWVSGSGMSSRQSRIPCKKEAIELVLSEGTTIFSLPPKYFNICLPRLKRCSLAILWYCFSFEAGCTWLRKKGCTLSIWRMCWFHLHQVRAKDEAC